MGKKKARLSFFICTIIFLIGTISWACIILIPQVSNHSGNKLGSVDQDIVLEFHGNSRRDYWEISYTTLNYYAVIYLFDACNYEAYLEGRPLGSYETLINDQITPLKIKINTSECSGNRDMYIVWNFWKGIGVRVNYEYTQVRFRNATGFLIYFFSGLAFCSIGLGYTTNIRQLKQELKQKRQIRRKKRRIEQKRKMNITECKTCSNDISLNAEFCPFCGAPLSTSKTKVVDYNALNRMNLDD